MKFLEIALTFQDRKKDKITFHMLHDGKVKVRVNKKSIATFNTFDDAYEAAGEIIEYYYQMTGGNIEPAVQFYLQK